MAARPPRLTKATMAVLDVLASATADDDPVWGLRICERADIGPGTVYPILERLAEFGWIESWWESGQHPGRPARRYYRLTGVGRTESAAARAARDARRRWIGLGPASVKAGNA
jgi:PadR family transcriptional regulator PadR